MVCPGRDSGKDHFRPECDKFVMRGFKGPKLAFACVDVNVDAVPTLGIWVK